MAKKVMLFLMAFVSACIILYQGGIRQTKASEAAALFKGKTTEEVIKVARSGLNVPYVWGGTTKSGWDCSGYVTWVGKQLGVDMGRTTSDILSYGRGQDAQVAVGENSADFNKDYGAGIIKEGDVIVFMNDSGKDVHTGIVGGDYSLYHAWGEGASAYWFKPAYSSWCEGKGTVHCRFDKMWEVEGGHEKSYDAYIVFRGIEDKGAARLIKKSANEAVTRSNSCYSLKGAEYGVYSDSKCKKKEGTLTTDAKGNTGTLELKAGTYYVKELKAPEGFVLDEKVHSVEVAANETAEVKVTDKPKYSKAELSVEKMDREIGGTPQGMASLAGAEFTVKYYDNLSGKTDGSPKKTWVIQTKEENGKYCARLEQSCKAGGDDFYMEDGAAILPLGTYSIEKTKAPEGYLLEGAVLAPSGSTGQKSAKCTAVVKESGGKVSLEGGNVYSASDKIIRGGVKVKKLDFETKKDNPQGNAALQGAVFEIVTLSDSPVSVGGNTYKKGEVITELETDEEAAAQTESLFLPYGSYEIREKNPPAGYLGEGVISRNFDIAENGVVVDMTGEEQAIQNQIKRGDFEGVKAGGKKYKRLAGVPFEIKSTTTGETHTIVTDENGQFNTSADWTPHTQNTNQGSTHEDGIWFGEGEPDDTKGALLYDTYQITELSCEANKEYELIPSFEITVKQNKRKINLGTLVDDDIPDIPEEPEKPEKPEITIHTTAANKADGSKAVVANGQVTITDVVTIDGLEPGKSYRLYGWEMVKNKEMTAKLVVDEKPVENELRFTADDKTKKAVIEFTFPATHLAGSDVVVFEELYDMTEPEHPELVAEHKDIENRSQTVSIKKPVQKEIKKKAEKKTTKKVTEKKTVPVPRAPKTGDTSPVFLFVFILLAVLSCIAIIRCVTIMRK